MYLFLIIVVNFINFDLTIIINKLCFTSTHMLLAKQLFLANNNTIESNKIKNKLLRFQNNKRENRETFFILLVSNRFL